MLPSSLLEKIFMLLSIKDLAQVSKCCKLWNQISRYDAIWRQQFVVKFREPDVIYEQTWKQRFQTELGWKEGQYQTNILKGHSAPVNCLYLEGDFLLSGGADSKIRLWNITSKQYQSSVLHGHRKPIRQVFLESFSGTAISSSEDKSLRIWDITTEKTVKTIFFGTVNVTTFLVDKEKNTLITAAIGPNSTSFLRVWDMNSWEIVRTIHGPELEGVTCLDLRYDTIVTGGTKGIQMWSLGSGQVVQTFPQPNPITCLQIHQSSIVSGTNSGRCTIYDLLRGDQHSFEAHPGAKITSLQADSNKIVTCSPSSGVSVWSINSHHSYDFANEKILYSIPFKSTPIKCLKFEQQILATGHQDNTIRITHFGPESTLVHEPSNTISRKPSTIFPEVIGQLPADGFVDLP